jgi:nitrogen-specific signal transduction histidine kinase
MEYNLIDYIFTPVAILDHGGRVIQANKAFSMLSGKSIRAFKRNIITFADLFEPEDKMLLDISKRSMDEQKVLCSDELSFEREYTTLFLIFKFMPMGDNVLAIVKDNSIERTLQNRYKDKITELKETRKHNIESSVVSNCLVTSFTEKIQDALSFSKRNIKILFDECSPTHNLEHIGNEMRESLTQINRVSNRLLNFSHNEDSVKQTVLINEFLQKIRVALLRIQVKKTVGIELKISSKLDGEMIYIDKKDIFDVFKNIYLNSLKAISLKEHAPNIIKIIATIDITSKKYKLDITFSDQGIGFDKEVLIKAFLPFVRSKKFGRGEGMGLAISEKIVNDNGGTITINPNKKVGSEVNLTFPISAGKSKQKAGLDRQVIFVKSNDTALIELLTLYIDENLYGLVIGNEIPEDINLVDIVLIDHETVKMKKNWMQGGGFDISKTSVIYFVNIENYDTLINNPSIDKIDHLIIKPFSKSRFTDAIKLL